MQHLKKLFSLLLCLPVMLGIAACGRGQESSSEEIEKATPVEQTSDSGELLLEESSEIVSTFIPETTVERDSTLVVVFSATGTTKGIAERSPPRPARTFMRSLLSSLIRMRTAITRTRTAGAPSNRMTPRSVRRSEANLFRWTDIRPYTSDTRSGSPKNPG